MNIPYNKTKLDQHTCSMSDKGSWYVTNLIENTKNKENIIEFELDVMSISLNHYAWGKDLSLYDIITHIRQINDSDLDYPVILSEEGWVLDGWHRIAKAILQNQRYVKAVRFKKNPQFDSFTLINED